MGDPTDDADESDDDTGPTAARTGASEGGSGGSSVDDGFMVLSSPTKASELAKAPD